MKHLSSRSQELETKLHEKRTQVTREVAESAEAADDETIEVQAKVERMQLEIMEAKDRIRTEGEIGTFFRSK